MQSKTTKVVVAVSGALTVVGVAAWVLSLGSSWSLGMTDYVSWGLVIAGFLALEAVAAGALFFACFGDDFDVRKKLVSVSLAATVASVVAIVYDLGTLGPFWRLFFAPHFQAPMALDVVVLQPGHHLGRGVPVRAGQGKAAISRRSPRSPWSWPCSCRLERPSCSPP